MNIIHFMTLLCVLTTALNAITHETDAHTVARTIKSHIKSNIDPQCYTLQRELKTIIKNEINEAKRAMKDAQKKLYADFLTLKAELLHTQTQEMTQLKALAKVKNDQQSLKEVITGAHDYLNTLARYTQKIGNDEVLKSLDAETDWLKNIEKTATQAGISLTEPLVKNETKTTQSAENRSKKKHKATTH